MLFQTYPKVTFEQEWKNESLLIQTLKYILHDRETFITLQKKKLTELY